MTKRRSHVHTIPTPSFLLLLLVVGTTLSAGTVGGSSAGTAYDPILGESVHAFGEVRNVSMRAGEPLQMRFSWEGIVEWNDTASGFIVPWIPYEVRANGGSRGPDVAFELFVNGRLALTQYENVTSGHFAVKHPGWPSASEFGGGAFALGPFLARSGANDVHVLVTLNYDAAGEGGSTFEAGPLLVETVTQAALAEAARPPSPPPVPAQDEGRRETSAIRLTTTLAVAMGAALLLARLSKPPRM